MQQCLSSKGKKNRKYGVGSNHFSKDFSTDTFYFLPTFKEKKRIFPVASMVLQKENFFQHIHSHHDDITPTKLARSKTRFRRRGKNSKRKKKYLKKQTNKRNTSDKKDKKKKPKKKVFFFKTRTRETLNGMDITRSIRFPGTCEPSEGEHARMEIIWNRMHAKFTSED